MTGPTHGGDVIYLDHNATTPVAPEVAAAMWPYLTTHFGNPSSDHPVGRAAKDGVDTAREQVAALIGAHPDEIVFTSGGTESNNLAIRGVAHVAATTRRTVVTSMVEQRSTIEVKINYFKPVLDGTVECRSQVVYRGRTVANIDSVLTVGGVLVGKANGSFAIFVPRARVTG